MKYIYPCLGAYDLGFVRISGPGLANCMFVAARAYQYSKEMGASMVSPSWFKFSIGPYIRREKDKRHYLGLFKSYGITGLKKCQIIRWRGYSEGHINEFKAAEQGVLVVNGLGRYFEDLDAKISCEYFDKIIKDGIKSRVEKYNFADTIAVHVRLGDYGTTSSWSTPIEWYGSLIDQMKRVNPSLKFAIFSDGTDEQLQELTSREGVERVFFGNALADILAMGKCKVVIASNSTFSAWGAFLGQKPVLFRERLFGPVFADGSQLEYVLGDNPVLPNQIAEIVSR